MQKPHRFPATIPDGVRGLAFEDFFNARLCVAVLCYLMKLTIDKLSCNHQAYTCYGLNGFCVPLQVDLTPELFVILSVVLIGI